MTLRAARMPPGAQPPKLTLARSRFPGQRLNVIQHRAIRSTGCCPHLVAPDTLVSRLRSATTEIDTQSCRAERGTYIPHCPTRRKLSSPQRRAKREDNMKPTILTPILAVASLTVLAVPLGWQPRWAALALQTVFPFGLTAPRSGT